MTTTTKNNTNRKDFNFDSYNTVKSTSNSGLKLWIIEDLLSEVIGQAGKYNNPLLKDMADIRSELQQLRREWKAQAATAQRQTQVGTPTKAGADTPVFDANNFEVAIF